MPNDASPTSPETTVKTILEWVALAGQRTGLEEATGLRRHLSALREAALPAGQRFKLLNLLYEYAAKVTQAQFSTLHEAALPVSRKIRQLVRAIQDLLETLIEDYQEAATSPDIRNNEPVLQSLERMMQCLSWHLTISHLAAAPAGSGIWLQLHATFRSAHVQGLDKTASPDSGATIEQLYLTNLLLSVAHPASFNSRELEFIEAYIALYRDRVELSEHFPNGRDGVFWIDPERDSPPHALARRSPPPETPVFYFNCDVIARDAADHLAALKSGRAAADLGLPAFADSLAGHGVLRRLHAFWGHPAKRRFPRRRQSYRADLCAGLEQIWQLLRSPDETPAPPISEWMITNESPDGYAMMHVSGATETLRVGDIVALHPRREDDEVAPNWQICIVRWALSENPEHIEIGLQALASHGIPAMAALPGSGEPARTKVLLLPEAPPLRPASALVVPSGTLRNPDEPVILVMDQGNVTIRELRTSRMNEQTSSIAVLTVEPDERQSRR